MSPISLPAQMLEVYNLCYRQVLSELAYVEAVILRGDRLVRPDTEYIPGLATLWQMVVDAAHEGHQIMAKCKPPLCAKLWFPQMDKFVEDRVKQCLVCQATTSLPKQDMVTTSWSW